VAQERVQRRLSAILAADVVGYSRLMGADEEGTLLRLKALRRDVLDPKVADYRGRVVKLMGDGALVEFASAVDAVRCAVEMQQAAAAAQDATPEDRRIMLRIGVNLGDIIVEGDDIYGDGVNIAARLEALAEPGEIYVSGAVFDQIKNKFDAGFMDIGTRLVKNIAEPVRVYRLDLRAGSGETSGATAFAAEADAIFRRPAVAVLPFANLGADPEQQYFADGLTEDIITALTLWRSFPVIASNSSFTYKGRAVKVQQVAEELGARYVVEGTVRKGGNRMRVTAQLIDSKTGHHLWAERYDRELRELFAVQDELTEAIVSIVAPEIEHAEQRRAVAIRPSSLDAWEYVQRGAAWLNEFSKDSTLRAREMFERAVDLEPNYSQGHSGLAWTYMRDIAIGVSKDRNASLSKLLESAGRAVASDSADSLAHTAMSLGYIWANQLALATEEAEMAVRLNPTDARALVCLGHAQAMCGNVAEGIRNTERGLQLNPRDPRNHIYVNHVALAYLIAGQYDSAVVWAMKAISRNARIAEYHFVLACSLGHLGRSAEARRAFEACRQIDPNFVREWTGIRPYLSPIDVARTFDGLRKAGLPE
jgi:adenylate cyclase